MRSPYAAYQTAQAQTADRGQLLIMLYEGALKFLNRAAAALAGGDLPAAHEGLVRAQDIVLELAATLDESAGPIATDLAAIYDYLYQRLVEVNCQKDSAGLAEVSQLLRDLLDAWRAAVRPVAVPAQPAPTQVPVGAHSG